ncbi:hypothetical protein PhCBS80983_g01858 [Powellomyces hirtus]|uniref:Mannosyltransferase n=1 Tax=Powellomyces hirtus TaxID=109895 RepID=A0A507E9B3_9FUNG|nr:hypothetical protein PhCBS80983_g01858 [Powellomyces hirtus]
MRADCDEVFNYWEPTHYLQYGRGMQTWEYSPDYAIRSWTYAWLYSIVGRFMELLVSRDKITVFYETRGALAIASAFCEAKLYEAVATNVSPKVGQYFLLISMVSTGMFISSTAYLPSSFAMYAVTLAMAYSFRPLGRPRTYAVVMLIGAGALLGWPFSAAAGLPFVVEELLLSSNALTRLRHMVEAGIVSLAVILGPMVALDSLLYGKLAIVPWSIVRYNIFSGSDRGPDIYGTEPWWFYLLNGTLNFNLAFPMALLSLPAVIVNVTIMKPSRSVKRLLVKLLPVYLWLGIFTLQPHKEERFLFVVYPLICLNAAMTLFVVGSWINAISARFTLPSTASKITSSCIWTFLALFTAVSLSRTLALYLHYHAPIDVFHHVKDLPLPPPASSNSNRGSGGERALCVGKEWYRFPSHYFLPDDIRLRYLKSDFRGLLPKYFEEPAVEHKETPARGNATAAALSDPERRRLAHRLTYIVPDGMNDRNEEVTDRYVDISHCDYIVDYTPPHPSTTLYDPTASEPLYALDTRTWAKHYCTPFLDAPQSARVTRAFYVPGMDRGNTFNRWGEYCLLRRKE